MLTKKTPHWRWVAAVINQNGWLQSPKTNPHLFFRATRIIAPAPKIKIPAWIKKSHMVLLYHFGSQGIEDGGADRIRTGDLVRDRHAL